MLESYLNHPKNNEKRKLSKFKEMLLIEVFSSIYFRVYKYLINYDVKNIQYWPDRFHRSKFRTIISLF